MRAGWVVRWLAAPSGRWTTALVAGAAAAGVLAAGSVPAAFVAVAAANLVVAGVTTLLVRRGPARARVGRALPVAMLVGAALNLGLAAYVARNPEDLPPTLLDPLFLVLLPAMVWSSVRTWWSPPGVVPLTTVRRDLLDGLLVTAGVALVYVQAVLPALGGGRSMTPGAGLATAFVAGTVLVVAPLALHWWQSREPDDGWFATAGTLFALGTAVQWAALAGGADTRVLGAAVLTAAVLVVPAAAAHPGRGPVAPVRVLAETPAAVVVHFACWVLACVALVGHPVRVATVVLATLTMALVLARLLVVRQAQHDLIGRLGAQAASDPLTGLANRRHLAELMARGPGWLLVADLDGFKEVNDRHGHDAGDDVLRRFAGRLTESAPAGAVVARVGGDEFAVLVPGDRAAAEGLAHRVLERGADAQHAEVTISLGLARHSGDGRTGLRDADVALQEAKRAGKNRLVVVDEALLGRRLHERAVADRLRATGAAGVHVHYQPLVRLDDARVVALEALARWDDDELGAVPPAVFVPVAERAGIVHRIGARVLAVVLDDLAAWTAQGAPRQVSVNVSWQQLRDPAAVDAMAEALRARPDLARWLVLEVTESVFADEGDAAVAAVARLRGLGPLVAVDDFGVGSSTLTRLRELPVDVLKVDRSLLAGVGTDPTADAVLGSVAELGRRLGLAVVAEGVEDEVTADAARRLGVPLAQGFLFARPVAAHLLPDVPALERPAIAHRPGLAPVALGS